MASSTTIGTDGDGISDNSEYNVIGGNTSSGILLSGGNVYNNLVSGNYIGTDPTRTVALPNGGNGITVTGAAHDITIGDPDNPHRNYIAYNSGNGINVSGETTGPVAMISNQIWENDLLGINIAPAGVNANDPGDPDAGPNNLMNYPSIASATVQSTNLIISYSVDSDSAITKYPLRVEFFEADADQEEGQTFIGFDEYSKSDYAGCGSPPCNAKVSFFSTGYSAGDTLVATATDAGGEWNTSEFSPPTEITEGSGASISLRLKAFLEGPFAGGQMGKALNTGGYLPLAQPFSDALFDGKWVDYDSVQTVVSHADSTVDWVLVALLSDVDPGLEIPGTRHAAVISENGIVTTPGSDSLVFNSVADGTYALLFGARNHITIMSASAFPVTGGVGSYDFTTAATQAFGTDAMKSLSGGVWGLFSGDSDADGNVTAPDFNDWNAATSAGATGYQQSDFNMDGIVTAPDFNLWNANTSAGASSNCRINLPVYQSASLPVCRSTRPMDAVSG